MRTQLMLGREKHDKLRSSRVTVIGLGAVGSYAVEGLARAGIGSLRLIDHDNVTKSNINRQLYALSSTVGRAKAELAKERVLDINPYARVEALQLFVAADSLDMALDNSPHMVVDAIDSLNPKVQLLATLQQRRIPHISSMGAAKRTDPFSVKIGDISGVSACPLGKNVRKRLRKYAIDSGVLCVYSDEKVMPNVDDPSLDINEDFYPRGRKRTVLGSLPTLTGVFGLIIANHVINYLCGGFYDNQVSLLQTKDTIKVLLNKGDANS